MRWLNKLVLIGMLTAVNAINRPVYKIVLTQKGFAQFLQYDIETPPLREFTFCTWIRVYDLGSDQSIFTYVANGDNRVVRLWLESGGRNMKISINGRVTSSSAVDIVKQVWRHLCLSYQSDHGAWALYVDARLLSCEASQSLYDYVLPGGGSVIVGYGTANNGAQNGFEGEIFGANMILASTIERNHTSKNDPLYEQKSFTKNKIKGRNNNNYVVLSDLQTDEIHNNYENTEVPIFLNTGNTNKSYIKIKTPYNYVEHDVGLELSSLKKTVTEDRLNEISDFTVTNKPSTANFWTTVNEVTFNPHINSPIFDQSRSGFKNYPTISEYETPPPLFPLNKKYKSQSYETKKSPAPLSIYKIDHNDSIASIKSFKSNKKYKDEISEVETPPPVQKNTKVYGQWTSSKFAGSVLNYLKSINFQNREQKKPPPTIPHFKISDSFPYASEFKLTKIRPPSSFQRKNIVSKRLDVIKSNPEINVQILEDDLRNNIIKSHARTKPKQVDIFNRGEAKKSDRRFYRHIADKTIENTDSDEDIFKPKKLPTQHNKNHKYSPEVNLKNNNLLSILPFLKSLEYFVDDSTNAETKNENTKDMYSKSLLSANKWHNVKSYNNDYTPRRITMDGKNEIEQKVADFNKKIPSIRLNYKHNSYKVGKPDDVNIVKARELAMEVSNQSNINKDSISILKYNHGFLPNHDNKVKISDKLNEVLSDNLRSRIRSKNNFNKHVKIGNALNERLVLGVDENHKKVSFVGGDETIPDIIKYRSDLDTGGVTVPASLGPRACKNVELYDRVLYVQPDESIDMTHILSPVRGKNIGIEFIIQNYKKCSLTESLFEKSALLFINWNKTPVRLFGGAYPKTTTDLCGFF